MWGMFHWPQISRGCKAPSRRPSRPGGGLRETRTLAIVEDPISCPAMVNIGRKMATRRDNITSVRVRDRIASPLETAPLL
jgi:hypothetical protein